jgi:hypothetical protein
MVERQAELLDNFRSIMRALQASAGEEVIEIATGARAATEQPTPQLELRAWEEESRQRLRERVSSESPSRYALGTWSVAYSLAGGRTPPLAEFSRLLRDGIAPLSWTRFD